MIKATVFHKPNKAAWTKAICEDIRQTGLGRVSVRLTGIGNFKGSFTFKGFFRVTIRLQGILQ